MLATKKDARLSLRELFIYGFNYTVGITFIFGFSSLFNQEEPGANLGLHII